jgi:hypothetical protein
MYIRNSRASCIAASTRAGNRRSRSPSSRQARTSGAMRCAASDRRVMAARLVPNRNRHAGQLRQVSDVGFRRHEAISAASAAVR